MEKKDVTCSEVNISTNVNGDDEAEEQPLWMRYMARNKIIPTSTGNYAFNVDDSLNSQTQGAFAIGSSSVKSIISKSDRKRVVLKRSLNSFGPTSNHALSVEKKLQEQKRKRNEYYSMDSEINATSSAFIGGTNSSSPNAVHTTSGHAMDSGDVEGVETNNNSHLGRKKRQRTANLNISEAAELFSIVKLK